MTIISTTVGKNPLEEVALIVNKRVQNATEKSREIAPEGMKRLSQSRNTAQLWMCLVVKVKSDAIRTILHRYLE